MKLSTRTTNMILALTGLMWILSQILTKVDAPYSIIQMLYWTSIFGLVCGFVNAVVIEVVDMVRDVVDFVSTNMSEIKERWFEKK